MKKYDYAFCKLWHVQEVVLDDVALTAKSGLFGKSITTLVIGCISENIAPVRYRVGSTAYLKVYGTIGALAGVTILFFPHYDVAVHLSIAVVFWMLSLLVTQACLCLWYIEGVYVAEKNSDRGIFIFKSRQKSREYDAFITKLKHTLAAKTNRLDQCKN